MLMSLSSNNEIFLINGRMSYPFNEGLRICVGTPTSFLYVQSSYLYLTLFWLGCLSNALQQMPSELKKSNKLKKKELQILPPPISTPYQNRKDLFNKYRCFKNPCGP